jgi:integrase
LAGLHHLRHTYGSMLRDQGVDMCDIMRWMGHSSIDVTIGVYGHTVRDHGPEEAQKMDAFFAAPGDAKQATC